jgi:peptidoglycan/xylan/chitin deacetylase (PgdA/CDA1 family)
MSWKHALWRAVSAVSGRPSRPGLRVLCYHSVGTDLPGDPYGLSLPPAVFGGQMDLLASGGLGTPVALGGAKLDGSPEICVTFDDGYADALTAAAPVLAELGLPFTVCVTP